MSNAQNVPPSEETPHTTTLLDTLMDQPIVSHVNIESVGHDFSQEFYLNVNNIPEILQKYLVTKTSAGSGSIWKTEKYTSTSSTPRQSRDMYTWLERTGKQGR